ncbi:hypothetical protein [Aeromonas sp. CA23]|uniref:hypothetical protein n=1 Tax=Aeromonas sp. CA23 TaxID=2033032 RepID=UPI0012FE7207|nr:hypothetical protein [Aeromonas sp. CA23]
MKSEIYNFLDKNIDFIEASGGGGAYTQLPVFELTPRDFISFAEKDLEGDLSPYTLVNATSNLKRAIDCQLDYILIFLNLDSLYRKKRLGIDRKLGFLSKSGIFSSRSIEKLNKLRNRLEHHYEIPEIKDVDVYFDLVSAFVSICENYVISVLNNSEVEFSDERSEKNEYGVTSEINVEKPFITISLDAPSDSYKFVVNLEEKTKPNLDQIENFAYLLKTHTLLFHYYSGAITKFRLLQELKREV